jgi:glutathione S-transferase
MLLNENLLPLLGLARHLTYKSSCETVVYMERFKEEFGWWEYQVAKLLVPIFYWRRWRKMGNRILQETHYEEYASNPTFALFAELEKVQEKRGKKYFGGDEINMVDLWLFGMLRVMKDETLFGKMEANCPQTKEWIQSVQNRMKIE